ncbi:MAG: amidohydrolase family protein [Proteobacteria bacterium]|nr:amidohydrolase family protein [Pseudomonadota bacterium]
MTAYTGAIFDADNHYYEAHDAFTRHVPKNMRHRCVDWVELEGGRKYHVIGGKIDRSGNPTFNPISKPGVLREYFSGNPNGLTTAELVRRSLEPMPPEYMDRDARIARLEEQRLQSAWLFPTQGVLYEELLKKDIDALCTTFSAFNRWLDEDWGLVYKDRLFSAPYITLADVDWACEQLEWALERDARMIVMRPSAVFTRNGPRNPGHKDFDRFWARVNESGITVVAHIGQTRHDSNGYDTKNIDSLSMGSKPSVTNFHRSRNINDFLASLVFDRVFERFPNVRVASVENGAEFLGSLITFLDHTRDRIRGYFKEDPVESFKQHVWINPFWEDDIPEVIGHMGADRVILGSDWPHMEGLEHPRDILDELGGVALDIQEKILLTNTAGLNERRPA